MQVERKARDDWDVHNLNFVQKKMLFQKTFFGMSYLLTLRFHKSVLLVNQVVFLRKRLKKNVVNLVSKSVWALELKIKLTSKIDARRSSNWD